MCTALLADSNLDTLRDWLLAPIQVSFALSYSARSFFTSARSATSMVRARDFAATPDQSPREIPASRWHQTLAAPVRANVNPGYLWMDRKTGRMRSSAAKRAHGLPATLHPEVLAGFRRGVFGYRRWANCEARRRLPFSDRRCQFFCEVSVGGDSLASTK